jgi:hypothetical protein
MLLKILQDPRTIYVVILIAIVVPFTIKLELPTPIPPVVQKVFDKVEEVHADNKPVLISFDFDPSTKGECKPMADAIVRHCFYTGTPVIGMTFLQTGVDMAQSILVTIAAEFNQKYGEGRIVEGRDYVWLGFKPNIGPTILAIGSEFTSIFPKDWRQKPLSSLPMMQNVRSLRDVGLVVSISGSTMPDDWVTYANTERGIPVAIGTTAVSATTYFPYIQTRQVVGLIPGATGAAAYERLVVDHKYWPTYGEARALSNPLSATHVVIVLFIIIGNVMFFIKKRQKQ